MRKTFKVDGDFGAFYAAEKWCKDNGYSVGSMERERPIGLAKDASYVSKWCNLSGSDKKILDGVIAEGSKRNNDVTVIIFDEVDQRGVYQ